MNEKKVISVETISGAKHYVIRSLNEVKSQTDIIDPDQAKFKKAMRKEARKPMLVEHV